VPPIRGISLTGVPNQVCSQCRTNWIEPPVTDTAHMMDRTNSASDGKCCTDPDACTAAAVSHTATNHWVGIALDSGDTLAADTQTLQTPHFLLTRVRCEEGFCDISMPVPQEGGFTVVIQLRELPEHELWLRNTLAHSGRYPEHGVCTFNFEHQPRFRFATSFDSLQFHIRREVLDCFTNEHGKPRIDALSWPHGARDRTLSHLASALLPVLRNPHWATKLFLDHIGQALIAHFISAYGGACIKTYPSRGGLSPWQELRCIELVTARIAAQISLEDLANECRLSVSYFARAFKCTFGEAPHRWLLRQRVRAAEKMLAGSENSISAVAIACGFADQSHLTRVFSRIIGVPPGAWRRRNDALLRAGV
jgi:AraC family transcriptional regulator